MKKIYTLIAMSFLMTSVAFSQLADGSVAPDWTLTDINGNEHTLYDYLDQGYSVVLDFSATWCGPCWGYHNSGALEDLYVNHGPAGMPNVSATTTDDVMVFMIEGDGSTTTEDLNGSGTATQGDWVTGTPYAIIDDDAITESYAIGYWPTIYTVCPDRTITESGQVGTSVHYEGAGECGFASLAADLRMVSYEGDLGLCGGEFTPAVNIQNLSTSTVYTSATIIASQAGTEVASWPWTGSLDTYDTDMVTLDPVTGVDASMPVTFSIIGEGDLDESNNDVDVSLTAALTSYTVTLELLTDNYGAETSWDFRDESGAVVASGNGYGNNTLYEEEVSLPSIGCFTFNIYDSYGDGICCAWGDGNYTLKDNDGNVIVTGGEFADEYTELFENDQVSGIEEISDLNDLSIYPNPVENNVNIAFDLAKSIDTQIEIFNLLGERVYSRDMGVLAAGSQLLTIDLSTVDNGVYFLAITSEGKVSTKKITVSK